MTLDRMKYFLAAATYQSVTKASLSAHISPSAISDAISKLETEYACELFRREGKYIFLTHQGNLLKQEFEKVFDLLSSIKNGIGDVDRNFQGEFRLGASHYLSSRQLAQSWSKLQNEHPNLKGELVGMHTSLILIDLLRGILDFALCFSPLQNPKLIQRELYRGTLRMAVRKKHPILKFSPIQQLKQISTYPAIMHKSSPTTDLCENHSVFEKFNIKPNIRLYFDSDDQALSSIQQSDAWTLVPDICLNENLKGVEFLPTPKGWDANYSICSVVPANRVKHPVIQKLEEELIDIFSQKGLKL